MKINVLFSFFTLQYTIFNDIIYIGIESVLKLFKERGHYG